MQSELRNAPGGSGLSSTHKVRTGGAKGGALGGVQGGGGGGASPQKGGRRGGASSAAAAGAAAAAADAKSDAQPGAQASNTSSDAGAGAGAVPASSTPSPSKGDKGHDTSRPSSKERPSVGSQMTAAERIAAELSREEGIILVTCSACRVIDFPLFPGFYSVDA